MNCKNCGSPLTGAETLCPMCGFQVNAYNNQAPVAGTVPVQPMVGVQPTAPVQGVPSPQVASADGGASQVVTGVSEMPVGQPNVPIQPAPMPVPTPIDPAVVSNVSQNMGTAQVNPMPVDNSQVMSTPVPVDPMTVNGVVQQSMPDINANPNMIGQPNLMAGGVQMQSQMQSQPQSLTTENQKQPKAGNKRQTILLIILVLCIIGAVVYYVFIYPEGSTSSGSGGSKKTNSDTSEVEVEKKDVTASFGGYSFTIPDGFIAVEGNGGLTISNYDTAYIVAVDYTNNLEAYKSAYLASNPQLATTLANTYFDRNYLLVGYIAQDGSNGVNFVSPVSADANTKEVFVGTVLKNGGVAPIPDDYSDLTTILNSGIIDTENSVKAGDATDAGKAGFYVSNVSANTITFNSN